MRNKKFTQLLLNIAVLLSKYMKDKAVFIANITSGITVGVANLFDLLGFPNLLNSTYKNGLETTAQADAMGMTYFKFKTVKLEHDVRGRLREINFNGINR